MANGDGRMLNLISDTQFRDFDNHFRHKLDQILDIPDLASLSQLMKLYACRSGKRLRPQLVIWTYLNASDRSESSAPEVVLDVATAWEIFHAFLLIHDDIVDGSDQRRNQPALHKQLQSLDSDSPRFGVNLGIVAGDLMYAATQRILSELQTDAESYRQLHRLFARVASLTGFGQAVDILQSHVPLKLCDVHTLLREYHWKTAAYTFEGPMLSGAILADLSDAARQAISEFALSIGQAYQIQNDLIDLLKPVSEGSDLVEGKRTLTLLLARSAQSSSEHDALDQTLSLIQNAPLEQALSLADRLRCQILQTPAVEQTIDIIRDLLRTSARVLQSRALPDSLRQSMRSILELMQQKYFTHDNPTSPV